MNAQLSRDTRQLPRFNNMQSMASQICRSRNYSSGGVLLLILICCGLARCSIAFGGEIHEAAAKADLEKVKALLKEDAGLINSKEVNGI